MKFGKLYISDRYIQISGKLYLMDVEEGLKSWLEDGTVIWSTGSKRYYLNNIILKQGDNFDNYQIVEDYSEIDNNSRKVLIEELEDQLNKLKNTK